MPEVIRNNVFAPLHFPRCPHRAIHAAMFRQIHQILLNTVAILELLRPPHPVAGPAPAPNGLIEEMDYVHADFRASTARLGNALNRIQQIA